MTAGENEDSATKTFVWVAARSSTFEKLDDPN